LTTPPACISILTSSIDANLGQAGARGIVEHPLNKIID
jgi:hypothetical protein